MFNKSRRRIVLSIMGSLILLFVITLSVILLASYREIRQKNTEMLERYVDLYSLNQQPEIPNDPMQESGPLGQKPPDQGPPQGLPPLDDPPDFQLSTFYAVAISDNGSLLEVDNGEKNLYTEDELASIAMKILDEGKASGNADHLTYTVSQKPGYTLIAFIDNTVSESNLNTLLHNMLWVGGAAIIVLFFVSLLLSRRIIHPLEENDRRQKQFISDASHELKTPVAVIGTNAELLSREIGNNEWLGNIQYENERMGELVRQLLDLSRAENAEAPMEQIDFSRLVTGETLAFETLAFDRDKAFQTDVEDGIVLTGSRTQLTQLVSILLDNAIRHTTGSVIGISLKRQGHHAVLSVINDSDEIPQDKLEHLFDRFYRVDEVRNSEGQHYGLGLSIAKAVVEKHDGSIIASCQDGKIRFTASIPIKK